VVSATTNNLVSSDTDLGAVVNNAANYGIGATTSWLNNTVGGNDIGQLTTSAIESVFGINFSTANQSVSGGGNPLQTGVQTPKGYSHTVNRSVIDASFNSIIGTDKVPKNIFASPTLGVDVRTEAAQLSTINQSASILLTKLASTAAGVAALSQIPGVSNIMPLLQSGQGLVSEIKGAAALLDKAKSLPGVGPLLKDIPGSGEVLAGLKGYGVDLLQQGANALGLDVSALTNFDTSQLLAGAKDVIADAVPAVEEAFSAIASFW
jgi:hypothetical protein